MSLFCCWFEICSYGDFAVLLWDTWVGSSPNTWNQGNPATTVSRPQTKFQVWIWKALTLELRSRTKSRAADLRAQGRLRAAWEEDLASLAAARPGGHLGGAQPGPPWAGAAPGGRAALPRGSRDAPIVLRTPSGGPPAGAIPASPTAAAPEGPAARPSPCSPQGRAPAPPADSEFSPPWLHN